MFYRLASVGIVAFWLVMIGLLVRLETHPEETDILDVPVSYVMRIIFKHGQESLMAVTEGEKIIGSVSLRPSMTGSDGRSLIFAGTLSLQSPLDMRRQRINLKGAVDMDAALRVVDFQLGLSTLESHYRLKIDGNVARKTISYQSGIGEQLGPPQTLPMDAGALGPALLQNLGFGANALPVVPGNIAPPTVTARETQISLRGEQLQVYQIAIREGTAMSIDFYVTQLGQIVLMNSNFGYTLTAED